MSEESEKQDPIAQHVVHVNASAHFTAQATVGRRAAFARRHRLQRRIGCAIQHCGLDSSNIQRGDLMWVLPESTTVTGDVAFYCSFCKPRLPVVAGPPGEPQVNVTPLQADKEVLVRTR